METKTLKPGQNYSQTSGKFAYFIKSEDMSDINKKIKDFDFKRGKYKIVKYQVLRGKTLWELLNKNYKSKLPKIRRIFYVLYV